MKDLKPIIKSLLHSKMTPLLLILQVAVTFTILVNSIYLMVEKRTELNNPSGLAEDSLFSFQMSLNGENTEERVASLYRDLESIRALDSVAEVTTVSSIPLSHRGGGFEIRVDPNETGYITKAAFFTGGHQIIDTMGLNLIAGEGFSPVDEDVVSVFTADRAVDIVITKALAQELYPEDWHKALGKTVYLDQSPQNVRGIVEYLVGPWNFWPQKNNNVIYPTIFVMSDMNVLVRAHKGQLENSMRDVVELLMQDPTRYIDELKSMNELKETAYQAQNAAYTTLQAVIIGLSLITMLAVFGQARFAVLKRRKQIGTRRALGASRAEIIRYFTLENTVLTVCGIAIGMVLTILANNLIVEHFELSPVPMPYLIYGGIIIFVAGFVAVIQPAVRAANVSPAEATRAV
ncbi:ABC transporter permease [Pseudoalteromonas luteoviolacea]|uniref:Uncharacterized protein n=1 Tax=Pseudoalteromonas luteoviolacea H33 TaxID=1365251 RepID=A0A167E9F4_9GAMM|nr:FtsX-like permease family protein [Pseudoalteromonas luteoviolacea]KZN50253.1 hypothetical protein N476_16570 [Pseudoalteromonas luteoviolacea H33]KZN76803.1 hypothetical protein N477_14470 [Pseudoalteromonas luteoviolacea H33-S]MBQ4877514.1 FtsX-like permease family protein [Pseudoalteromonas luteoviolacea]MBQ4906387.1 FtsX-like permease family protein [Pseudoalteromonas luteoviolacea]